MLTHLALVSVAVSAALGAAVPAQAASSRTVLEKTSSAADWQSKSVNISTPTYKLTTSATCTSRSGKPYLTVEYSGTGDTLAYNYVSASFKYNKSKRTYSYAKSVTQATSDEGTDGSGTFAVSYSTTAKCKWTIKVQTVGAAYVPPVVEDPVADDPIAEDPIDIPPVTDLPGDGVDNGNGNCWWVSGYTRRNGTYVRGHFACRH